MYIYCIHVFISLFIIPSQSVLAKVLPNLWQRRLEKPLLNFAKSLMSYRSLRVWTILERFISGRIQGKGN